MAQRKKIESVRRLSYLSMKVGKILSTEGIEVSKDQDLELKEIINSSDNPFNDETRQANGKSKGMRWHFLMIQWCLSIYHTSPAAYQHITSKRNKFLVLPHVNTLKKYFNYTTPSSGFNKDVVKKIIIDPKLSELQEYKRMSIQHLMR